MGDRVKERDRKGWKERGINYWSSSGRRESPITPYLSGIYNYIMMHPLSHQVNRQSLFLALAVTPSSLFLPPVLGLLFPISCFFSVSTSLSCLQREKWIHCGYFLSLSQCREGKGLRYPCVKCTYRCIHRGCKHVVWLCCRVFRLWRSLEAGWWLEGHRWGPDYKF